MSFKFATVKMVFKSRKPVAKSNQNECYKAIVKEWWFT